jgi:hypothetical protein
VVIPDAVWDALQSVADWRHLPQYSFAAAVLSVIFYAALRHAAAFGADNREHRLGSLGLELFIAAALVSVMVKAACIGGAFLSHGLYDPLGNMRDLLLATSIVLGLTQVMAFVLLARAPSLNAVPWAIAGAICVAVGGASDFISAELYGTFDFEDFRTPLLLTSAGAGIAGFFIACNTVRNVALATSAYELADGARYARNVIIATVVGTGVFVFVMPQIALVGLAVVALAAFALLRSARRLSTQLSQPIPTP